MLKLISPVSDVFRKDYEIDTTYLTTNPNYTGSAQSIAQAGLWVKVSSATQVAAVGDPNGASDSTSIGQITAQTGSDGEVYVQIWNEKGDYGVQALGKVSTLFLGKYEAITDNYGGTIAVGDLLTVNQQGGLMTATTTGDLCVAQCTGVNSAASTVQYIKISPFTIR